VQAEKRFRLSLSGNRHVLARAVAVLAAFACLCAAPAAAAPSSNGGTASPIDTSQSGGAAPTPPRATTKTSSAPKILHVVCVPKAACSGNPHQVTSGGRLQISGNAITAGMTAVFPRGRGRGTPTSSLHSSALGLVAAVPRSAASGKIYVKAGGRRSQSYGPIAIVSYKLHPPPPPKPPKVVSKPAPAPVPSTPVNVAGSPFAGQGMWIWYVSKSDGGDLASIVAQAHAAGVSTVYVKSSDGASNYWSQFSPTLVQTLHANGLHVCAWQYVYGTNPAGEANLGAEAVANGADCLVIDAEAEYEGKYASAQTYINTLRSRIGPSYPIALASFPYVHYHESLPYSVFLGPGGAQFNLPQMYWKDIGTSVDTVYANTFIANRVYGRPILPLGQTYGGVSTSDLERFRAEAPLYGAGGYSWWDWQETTTAGWAALAAPLAPLTTVTPNPNFSTLSQGNRGDQVLWMQEHLAGAIPAQATTGIFDATTAANLQSFQAAHGLPVTGTTTAATWQALLNVTPVAVNWAGTTPSTGGGTTTTGSSTSTATTATITTLTG
jgi:peptidoglycan hydrolase-like protein with peptidoglycan-binding domain